MLHARISFENDTFDLLERQNCHIVILIYGFFPLLIRRGERWPAGRAALTFFQLLVRPIDGGKRNFLPASWGKKHEKKIDDMCTLIVPWPTTCKTRQLTAISFLIVPPRSFTCLFIGDVRRPKEPKIIRLGVCFDAVSLMCCNPRFRCFI
jgi:hypothetical protein